MKKKGLLFGFIIVVALLAFEIFNYSTTEYALTDLLGGETLWVTILTIAFCAIDLVGLAGIEGEKNGIWYLFGAWLLAATLNAGIVWWGVNVALANGGEIDLLPITPVAIAVLIWVIRIWIIGTFMVAGNRLFMKVEKINKKI